MNSIYKVIWSKAKNCYVVASEIARSHTKSASGSEKNGGVARHALLALGAACAIACGGFVNVGAAVQRETISPTGTTSNPVLTASNLDDDAHLNTVISVVREDKLVTKDNIAGQLTDYAKASDLSAKADANDVYSKTDAENTFATKTELGSYATRTELDAKANTNLSNLTEEGKNAIKTTMAGELANKADATAVTTLEGRVGVVEGKVTALETTVSDPSNGLVKKVTDLKTKTTQISFDPAEGTTVNGVKFKGVEVDANGKGLTGVSTLHTTGAATIGGALTAAGLDAGTGDIKGGSLSVTGDTSLKKTDVDGALNVTGESSLKNTKVEGTLGVTGATTLEGTLTAEKDATFEKDVTVKGTTNLKDTTVTGDLTVTGTITTDKMIFGDKANNNYTEIDHGEVTSKNLVVNGAGEIISSSSTFNAKENKVGFANSATGEQSSHKQTSDMIVDNVKNNITGDQSFHKQTSDVIMDNVKDGKNSNNRTQTKTETKDIITDEKGNSSTTSQTASENKTYLKDKDGKNTNSTIDTAKGYDKTIKGENGQTSTKQDELNITNTAQNGTITNDAQNIVNNASENITNKANTMDTTVTGKATESYGELETEVKGNEKHTVKGNQTNEVDGKQINTIKNGQENIISGGQINNITGDQTTTITGNKTETVTENVTEDYKKNLTTTVGGNEIHEVKGTKTETVEGKVTEKFNNGQETTVTGNQDIHVTKNQTNKIDGNQANTIGGDQTTTAKNITNAADETLTDKVGNNTRVTTSRSITDTVGRANRMIEDGKITDYAGDSTVTTEKDKGTTFTKRGSMAYRDGGPTDTNISGNTITTGKVTMDYAQVMKDLGVHGNAKVDQNLEVGGTSTLKGDVTMESNAKVKKDLTVEGTTTTKTLKVTENATVDGTLDVTQKATFHDDVDIKKNLSVDGNATITGDVTARDVTARDVTAKSYKVGSNTYINADGINANNQKITNVADGSISEGSKDAVNGGQLYGVKRDLEHQVDKVGANAAAMANLRPMEFDPSSKWNIAAAIGNYGSETAAAIGAFYRPNDNVMVNLSTAFGTGENMVGGGVSVRLGKGGNKLSREETNALKAQVADLTARMDAFLSVLNPNMSKDFPDVPENHWAYEAVSRLAGNDIVQGYPDGEFHGERTMTRYEMAEIIYNALSRGAEAERKLVEEFKPELQAMAASNKSTAEKAEG